LAATLELVYQTANPGLAHGAPAAAAPGGSDLKLVMLARNPSLYSHRRIVEAARARGHDIDVINTLHVHMNITSSRPTLWHGGRMLPQYDAVIPRIGASITHYGLAVLRQFEVQGVFPLNESVAIGRSPCVIKLLEGTQGRGVILAETAASAKSIIEAFSAANMNILVQEYIKEAGGNDIRVLVIGGKVVASMMRSGKMGEFRANLHRGGKAEAVVVSEEERRTAVRSAEVLGLNVAGVDLLRSNRGPVVVEVNSSPGIEGMEQASGTDVAGAMIEFLERHAQRGETKTRGAG
jgi:ribosomal protein S6--L-glutamate ligase